MFKMLINGYLVYNLGPNLDSRGWNPLIGEYLLLRGFHLIDCPF
jgi:hypothetical protein